MKILDSEVITPKDETANTFKKVAEKLSELNATRWLAGKDYPQDSMGHTGDFYINTLSSEFFYKSKNGWEAKGSFKGQPGEKGVDGADGEPGFSAYELWLQNGNSGTVQQFFKSLEGKPGVKGERGEAIRGEKGDKGEKGEPGEDGREVLLRTSATHIQWKYEGEDKWKNLIALDQLKGREGKTFIGGGAAQQIPQIVNHAGVSNVARPAIASPVLWIGTVEPVNAKDSDLWVEPT